MTRSRTKRSRNKRRGSGGGGGGGGGRGSGGSSRAGDLHSCAFTQYPEWVLMSTDSRLFAVVNHHENCNQRR